MRLHFERAFSPFFGAVLNDLAECFQFEDATQKEPLARRSNLGTLSNYRKCVGLAETTLEIGKAVQTGWRLAPSVVYRNENPTTKLIKLSNYQTTHTKYRKYESPPSQMNWTATKSNLGSPYLRGVGMVCSVSFPFPEACVDPSREKKKTHLLTLPWISDQAATLTF